MAGSLFSRYFLNEGILQSVASQALTDADLDVFAAKLRDLFAPFGVKAKPNEATTESEIILPILAALGWCDVLPQQNVTKKGRDVPNILLFPSDEAKAKALAAKDDWDRYQHGLALVESKRWQRPLDRGDASDAEDRSTPSSQVLSYLRRVGDTPIEWALLTNGRVWRLYWAGARSKAEEFLEIDLPATLGLPGFSLDVSSPAIEDARQALRVFLLLFRRSAFVPDPSLGETRTFFAWARDEARRWGEAVSNDLGKVVFDDLFPRLVAALIEADTQASRPFTAEYLDEVRQAALTLLYRLLFLLYAEDRDLLPVVDVRYDDYSLRKVRVDVAARVDRGDVFAEKASHFDGLLKSLFRVVDEGDDSIGVPPYNGGLFDPKRTPLLDRVRLGDGVVARLIDGLGRRKTDTGRTWIQYRDLKVQQLGSIYEGLLEFALVEGADGRVQVAPAAYARKTSGSYYTHDDLVSLVVARTLAPLVDEKVGAFERRAKELEKQRRPTGEKLKDLAQADPASTLLSLTVCDPAMGSGHFLVAVVDLLADQVLAWMEAAAAGVDWASPEHPYESPLSERLHRVREDLLATARERGWTISESQLEDRHVVRRMILKRVIHGVDKNPMAVELAKLSLWLHTFTVGAPLSFLDHQLRCGDSLFGEFVGPVRAEVEAQAPLILRDAAQTLANRARPIEQLSALTDITTGEVKLSRELFAEAEASSAALRAFLDFWQARRWLRADEREVRFDKDEEKRRKEADKASFGKPGAARAGNRSALHGAERVVFGSLGDPLDVLVTNGASLPAGVSDDTRAAALAAIEKAQALSRREHFFHWPLMFPTVWKKLDTPRPEGGFDAIVGNPPWDRMKLQEVEWFALRAREVAGAVKASDRKRRLKELQTTNPTLFAAYEDAAARAEIAAKVARESGAYPLLSGGDVNLYSLFVERALALVAPQGLVGLLVPSGIASDKGAADFFKGIATTERLGALIDFENKGVFFPDVHARFKFAALVFGGRERTFPHARCSFFVHAMSELNDPERCFRLKAADFAAVNPNTGTAPVFRTRRDAALTTAIYKRLPVLVDRRHEPPVKAWPVRYTTMFHMTNDSNLFKTKDELDKDGFFPVGGNVWRRKPGEDVVPLYVGRMIHQFDHRAASVTVNEENLHVTALSGAVSDLQKADPGFSPEPQYWVPRSELRLGPSTKWTIAFRDIARATDARTIIAAAIPRIGAGNKLPLLVPEANSQGMEFVLANLNSFALDFVARSKVHSTSVNWYIVEQFPVIPLAFFQRPENQALAQAIRRDVLALTYTAHDMAPFARDLGFDGAPFAWDEEERLHRRCRLDAIFFGLYGLSRDEAGYVLDTFPIVKANDVARFGSYRTKTLILRYMAAVAAGDWTAIYNRLPVLVDRRHEPPVKAWPVRYTTMFHMTNDSNLFKTKNDLDKDGFFPVGGGVWKKGAEEMVPLYVGRMIHQFDHRAASVTVNEENLHNTALSGAVSDAQKADPGFSPEPQYWVSKKELKWESGTDWVIAFRDIARATDVRTMIATIVPRVGVGNTLPLVVADVEPTFLPLLLANLNSFVLDFVARNKAQSTHLNWYIVEQFPVIPLAFFQKPENRALAEAIRRDVLVLTYTAHDMAPFARDQGYEGAPFAWDDEDRMHRRCRLDAIFFGLYGLSRDEAGYVLDTFPIVKASDVARFGSYRTKTLVLRYMAAVAAGDWGVRVEG